MTAWDPIGVGDTVEAWGEYASYAPDLARILRETADPEEAATEIAASLTGIERGAMDLGTDESRLANARLAASLVAWYEWSRKKGEPC